MRFKAGDKQRIIQRPGHQRGNQPQLFIAEAIETIGIHAVQGQRANQRLPGKQRQSHAGMDFEALMTGDQPVIGVRQVAIRREAHHIPGSRNRLQPRVSFQGKAPTEHILRQAIDRQRHKLMRLIAQQRRGIAAKNLPQGSNQARKAVGVTNIAL